MFFIFTHCLDCIPLIKEPKGEYIMTIFKNLNIEVKKQYRNNRSVRRHIGLTPKHAMAIDEIIILHELEQGYTAYPSAIINFAMELLINAIDEMDENKQVEFILDGVNKYEQI